VFASIRTSCMTNKVRKIWDLGQRLNEVANFIAWLIGLAAASITLRCGMALVRLRQFLFELPRIAMPAKFINGPLGHLSEDCV
jgi:hypothetical protein